MLFGWFNNNFIKANIGKSHLIMSCAEATTAMIDGLPIDSSKKEVILGITIMNLNLMTMLITYAKKQV